MSPTSRRRQTKRLTYKLHSQAKILIEDVALWRLAAADRTMPYGWIEDAARACGVSPSTVSMAIGGQNWADITDPAPVLSRLRSAPRKNRQKRPSCPVCGRRKYARGTCRAPFHSIDHRTANSRTVGRGSPKGSRAKSKSPAR